MLIGVLYVACATFAADNDSHGYGDLEAVFGSADVQSCSGNGGLTVCANDYGRVTVCRWPSPSYFGQLRYRTHASAAAELGSKIGQVEKTPD